MPRKGIMEDLERVINGETPQIPPVLPIAIDEFITKQSGYTYREYSTNVDAAEEIWNKAIEKYDLDAALIFIDDFFEYEGFGIVLTDEENIPKAAIRHIKPEKSWIDSVKIPDLTTFGRMPMRLELTKRLKKKWGDSLLVCVSAAAPFTGVALLYGIAETMYLFYDDEQLLRDTIAFTTELSVRCSKALIENGADIIWFGDCAASGKFIDIQKFNDFVFLPTREAIKRIKSAGGKVIYHAGDKSIPHIKKMAELGADIVNCAEKEEMTLLHDAAQGNCCMMGNLDPIECVLNGTPESIEKCVSDEMRKMRGRKKYIFNTGEGIPVVTPENNVKALLNAMRKAKT